MARMIKINTLFLPLLLCYYASVLFTSSNAFNGGNIDHRHLNSMVSRQQSKTLSSMIKEPFLEGEKATISSSTTTKTRRDAFQESFRFAVGGIIASSLLTQQPQFASASGGATAGKYTTIPIAKRRYYGRVQQAVHDFLELGPEVVEQDMNGAKIQTFFDINGVVVVEAKRKDVNGQCTKKNNDCKGREVRDSRYNDMKTSMYLLANAFRINQQKPPDKLPTVIAAKAFFKEMDAMEKLVKVKKPKTKDAAAVGHYVAALEILDKYLDLVELPPTDSGHYDQQFDTLVGESARIT